MVADRFNAGGNPVVYLHLTHEGVEILQVASYYRCQMLTCSVLQKLELSTASECSNLIPKFVNFEST